VWTAPQVLLVLLVNLVHLEQMEQMVFQDPPEKKAKMGILVLLGCKGNPVMSGKKAPLGHQVIRIVQDCLSC